MKRILTKITLAALAVILIQGAALAEMFQGTVEMVRPADNYLKISHQNADTGQREVLDIAITEETNFSGIATLDELQVGEGLTIEASRDFETGKWQASQVVRA